MTDHDEDELEASFNKGTSVDCLNCGDWEPNKTNLTTAIWVAFSQGYKFKLTVMRYCPYCGEKLTLVNV